MMDREARRKFIRKVVRFWFKHNFAIAICLAVIFIATTITVLCVCIGGGNSSSEENNLNEVKETTVDDYAGVFDSDDSASSVRKDRTKTQSVVTASGETVEEVEYSTVLKYNESTRNGYMNNCVFFGDSRTVAMVSYGFVSDENVLAKVGISHTSVINYTFQQNSGKEYTIASYLSNHKPPVIYLGFGVNGMTGISEEKYEKTYKEMVEYIMQKAPDSEIVIMAIWPVDDNGPYKKNCQNSVINNYNAFLKTLAEYEGIYYLDVDTILKGDDGQIKPIYNAGDGLHYKSCAYTEILNYIIHHPVPGISDEGEFVVKYVKPSGEFKSMMKDTTELPSNVEVVESLDSANTVTPVIEEIPTPTPTPKQEQQQTQQTQQPEVVVIPSPSPTPTPTPTPTPAPAGGEQQTQPTTPAGVTESAQPTEAPQPETPIETPQPEAPTETPGVGDAGVGDPGNGGNAGVVEAGGGDSSPASNPE